MTLVLQQVLFCIMQTDLSLWLLHQLLSELADEALLPSILIVKDRKDRTNSYIHVLFPLLPFLLFMAFGRKICAVTPRCTNRISAFKRQ